MASISLSLAWAGFYTALFLIGAIALQWLVITSRRRLQIGLGTSGDAHLVKVVRIHGNYVENVVFCIAALTLMALCGVQPLLIHLVALLMLAGRILHVFGLLKSAGSSFGRVAGMVLTQASLVIAAIALLVQAFRILV